MGVIQFKGGSIQFKGGTGTIQFKNLGKVANPTVNAYYGLSNMGRRYEAQTVQVTNNDTENVTVYADTSATPSTSRGSLAGGATTSITISTTPYELGKGVSFTAYVQMKADGRLDSDIISDGYINPNQITNPSVEAFWQTDFISGDYYKAVTVTNHYSQGASVYIGLTSSNLQSQSTGLAAGAFATYVLSGAVNQTAARQPFTVYVQLKTAGKIDSEVISDDAEGIF